MTTAPSRGKIIAWTVVWLLLLLLDRYFDSPQFPEWLDPPAYLLSIAVGFYLLWLSYRWFAARR